MGSVGRKTPSAIPLSDRDDIQPIRYWQQRYERYLESIGRKETRKRYARAIERFLGKHSDKMYGHQFLRPVINQYVQTRLAEGASVSTVRLEMSAIRGLFQFMLDMGAWDLMFNSAKNVKVRRAKTEIDVFMNHSSGLPPQPQAPEAQCAGALAIPSDGE